MSDNSYYSLSAFIFDNKGEGVDYQPSVNYNIRTDASITLESLCEAFNQFACGVGYPMQLNERIGLVRGSDDDMTAWKAINLLLEKISDQLYDPEPAYDSMLTKMDVGELLELQSLLNIAGLNYAEHENDSQLELF